MQTETETTQITDSARVDPLAEVDAMRKVAEVLKDLPEPVVMRVLAWANQFFKPGQQGTARSTATGDNTHDDGENLSPQELYSRADPKTDAERALVMAYVLTKTEGREELDSFSINSSLTQMGHHVGNITRALGALMEQRPQLVIQTGKDGKTQQARKRYRVTSEGMRRVVQMLRGE